jgi:SNF2 family DNA or RNA helicase
VTHFRAKYFYQELWDQYRYYITPEKAKELTAQLTDLAMYMDPKDYLELPGLMDIVRPVKLTNMADYKTLHDEFILKMQDATVTAGTAGVLTNKLRQFTGGALYVEPGVWTQVGTDKFQALQELIEEMNGEPLIVAYEFNHEVERFLAAHPNAKAIRGGMATSTVQSIVSAWNAGEIPLLFVQPQAGAHGINLQGGGSAICWYSLTYNLESYIQLIARIYRQGQESVVRNFVLVAEGTIDEALVKILSAKNATQEGVFQALKAFAALGK